MFVAYNLGAASGGFIASWSIEEFGWHSVFFIGGAAAVSMFGAGPVAARSIRFLVVRGRDQSIAAIARKFARDDFSNVSAS
jgi:AAHS family 4-hydroxybenzoate transporter-like MFS transporter